MIGFCILINVFSFAYIGVWIRSEVLDWRKWNIERDLNERR